MEPSRYQKAIIDWARFGSGSCCCNAVAGSGKSTTLKIVAQALEADRIFLYKPDDMP